MIKKRFSVIFLILVLVIFSVLIFSSCEEQGVSPVSEIIITTMPQSVYYWGDSLNLSDSVVTLIYEDGSTTTKPLDVNMVSGFDPNILGEQILTIREGEATAYIKVTVITPPIFSLQVNSTTHKTEYVVGEEFDVKDLTILVSYLNGRSMTVPVEKNMVSGFDSTTTGKKQIVILYGTQTCNMSVDILPREVKEMQLVAPSKIKYIVGDTLSLNDGYIFTSYSDNTTEEVFLTSLMAKGELGIIVANEINTTFTKKQTTCVVTLYYQGREFYYPISVEDIKATEITVTKSVGDQIKDSDEFDFSEGEITVKYNNDVTEVLKFDDPKVELDLEGCDLQSIGTYEMQITIAGKPCLYKIKVVSPSPSKLEVIPDKNEIYQNELVDITKWKYKIKLNNDKYQIISGKNEFDVTTDMLMDENNAGIDTFTIGQHKYYFSILATNGMELKTAASFVVLKKEIVAMDIVNNGKQIYSEGDEFSITDTYFRLTYNNGDIGNPISVTNSMLRADENGTPFNEEYFLASAGPERKIQKRIYLEYTDKVYDSTFTNYYTITLVTQANKIKLLELPKKTFILGLEDFSYDDWQILITYSNNTTSTFLGEDGGLDGDEWKFVIQKDGEEKESFDEEGEYVVTLYYGGGTGVNCSYQVSVINNIAEMYVNSAHLGFIIEGMNVNLDDISLFVKRQNNFTEIVPVTQEMIHGYTAQAYKSTDATFVSAYVNANTSAAFDAATGNWENSYLSYYMNDNGIYIRATEVYDVNNDYRINLAEKYKDVWQEVRFNFFIDENGTRATGDYNETLTYFINNSSTLSINYQGKSVPVLCTTTAKKISSFYVQDYYSDYVKDDTEWNVSALRLNVTYNNGTTSIITGTRESNNPLIDVSEGVLSYSVNGLRYMMEIGKIDENSFVPYTFTEFKANYLEAVNTENKIFYTEKKCTVRIKDAATGLYVQSNNLFEVSCFQEVIENIKIVVGSFEGQVFQPYENQTVYLNEDKKLSEDAFIRDNDNQTVEGETIGGTYYSSFWTQVYIWVETTNEKKYYSLLEASNASEESFYIEEDQISLSDAYQTLGIGFLKKRSTISLEIRYNILADLEIIIPGGTLTVIENMSIDPEDIEIYGLYKDADNNMFLDEHGNEQYLRYKIDFRQATCLGYSSKEIMNFAESEQFRLKDIEITYGGISKNVVLTVRPKTLSGIRITTLPYKTKYIEMPYLVYMNSADKTNALEELFDGMYEGGKVSLSFDNGTTQAIDLSLRDVNKNSAEFTSAMARGEDLQNGLQVSYKIYVSYTYRGVTKETYYSVSIVDRKNISITFDSLIGYDHKVTCEYGAGKEVLPDPIIEYYDQYTDLTATQMTAGENNTRGKYFVQYRDANGILTTEWPKKVGTYNVIYSYFYGDDQNGDVVNNAFYDSTIILEITKKTIAIQMDEIVLSYGDILEGTPSTMLVNLTKENTTNKYWRMTAVENGIANGRAYPYPEDSDDNVIQSILFKIYDNQTGNLVDVTDRFRSDNIASQYRTIINLPCGTYYVKPEITLQEGANYEKSSLINNTRTMLTISKREVVFVAEKAQKVYGSSDPEFGFRIYDLDDVIAAIGGEIDWDTITAEEVFTKQQNGELAAIGSKSGVSYQYTIGSASYLIYSDLAVKGYNLSVDITDHDYDKVVYTTEIENGPRNYYTHRIFQGTELENYSITYVKNYLAITEAELVLVGQNAFRYYGTEQLIYQTTPETEVKSVFLRFTTQEGKSPLKQDTFASLFVNCFDDNGEIKYYNTETQTISATYSGNADNWCVLYKNVKIYTDENKQNAFGVNVGHYTAFPIAAPVGTYYFTIDTESIQNSGNEGLSNYIVSSVPTFEIAVNKTVVQINTESIVLTGNGSYKDRANSDTGKQLYAYFENAEAGIRVGSVDRETFDNDLHDYFKDRIKTISYVDDQGRSVGFKLSTNVLYDAFKFVRTDSSEELGTGIHSVTAKTPDGMSAEFDNFSIGVISYIDENTTYMRHFYDSWSTTGGYDLVPLSSNGADYSTFAYIVMLPEFVDFLPNQTDITMENGTPQLSYVYSRMRYRNVTFTHSVSLNGTEYEQFTDAGFSLNIFDTRSNKELAKEDILTVGTYKGIITYSYFDAQNKNYLYLGDTMVLGSMAQMYILDYIFDRNYMPDATAKALIFKKEFNYKITPVSISIGVVTEQTNFDNVAKNIHVELRNGCAIAEYDSLSLQFSMSVLYNDATDVQYFNSISLSPYILEGTTYYDSNAIAIFNAGEYHITVVSLGDQNYRLDNSYMGTITVTPIQVPIYILTNTGTLTIEQEYKSGDKGINPFDPSWKKSSDPNNDYTYRTDGTTACYIVKEYIVNSVVKQTNTDFVPNNLVVSSVQPDGSYPRNVKRDLETGEVIGYDVTYVISNSTFNNYSVIFVKKLQVGANIQYVALSEDEKYQLIINPKVVQLYGYKNIDNKVYDGKPASILGSDNSLTFIGAYNGDPIVRSGVTFKFTRPESSMYVGDYKYIRAKNDFTAEENITDAGVLHVQVIYTDMYGNQNYDIRFADDDVAYVDANNITHNDIALYTIEQAMITFDLKQPSESTWLNKQYDGYGLLLPSDPNAGLSGYADSLNLYGNYPIDSLSEMLYKLEIIRYGTTLSNSSAINATIADFALTKYKDGGVEKEYDIGYYWFNLRGVYQNADTGAYETFVSKSNAAIKWLSWNYIYAIKEPTVTIADYYNTDGIYIIKKRDVYITFNSEYRESDGMLLTSADPENAPTAEPYNYKITYDGRTYQADAPNNNAYCDFLALINDKNNSEFTYDLYVYQNSTYINVKKVVNLKDYYDSQIAGLTQLFSSYGTQGIQTRSDGSISAELGGLIGVTSNFNIVNTGNNGQISFSIRPRPINVKLTLVQKETNKAEMVYGTQFGGTTNFLYFKFEFEDGYEAYKSLYDDNLTDLQSVVNGIIAHSTGKVSLVGIDDNKDRFALLGYKDLGAEYQYIYEENGKTYIFLKVTDNLIDEDNYTLPSKLAANRYEQETPIARYITSGSDLTSSGSKYAINIIGTEFVVARRKVVITGVERTYFDKETNNYVYTVSNIDQEEANGAIQVASGEGHKMNDYIQDNTTIAANVGTWAYDPDTEKNSGYYIKIPKSVFLIHDSNYIIDIIDDGDERNVNLSDIDSWKDGKPVYINGMVYIPLTINKAKITINYLIGNDVRYGDIVSMDESTGNNEIQYVNLPVLDANGKYRYLNRATGEYYEEENVVLTGKTDEYGNNITLVAEQNSFKSSILGSLLYSEIKREIAYSPVNDGVYNLALQDYVSHTPAFDNYEVTWGSLCYMIVKKPITITMKVNESAYELNSNYFSAMWSERNDFKYRNGIVGDNLRLTYGVTVTNFSIHEEQFNDINEVNLGKLMAAVLGATYSDIDGSITYNDNTYFNTTSFMNAICTYNIYMYEFGNNVLATDGGDIRWIALKDLISNNFSITYGRTGIMLYPEIIGMGKYVENGEYLNLIPDTESSSLDVQFTFGTSETTIKNLSLLFRLNFIGLDEANSIQYVDTNKTKDYNEDYYLGMTDYNRTITLVYCYEQSSTKIVKIGSELPGKNSLQAGDVITVKIRLEESFYNGKYLRVFETPCFEINIKNQGSYTNGYRTTVANKTNTKMVNKDKTVGSYGDYLLQQTDLYYLNSDSGLIPIEGKYDIINMKARLIPTNESSRFFEIIAYENNFGKLVFGFDGEKSYARMTYDSYFINAANNLDDDGNCMYRADDLFYTFESFVATGLEDLSSAEYYHKVFEKVGNGYMMITANSLEETVMYYLISDPILPSDSLNFGELYCNYSESRITSNLVSIFDGNNHSFSLYLDKVGAFTNLVKGGYDDRTITDSDENYSFTRTISQESFVADRLLTLRVLVDNTTYLFTYIGEPYSCVIDKIYEVGTMNGEPYELNNTNITFYNSQMYAENGKTGINYKNLRVMINKYSIQNRLISVVSDQGRLYSSNVVFWPSGAEDSDVLYVTNEKTSLQIAEIMKGIGNVTISGGEDAYAPYDMPFDNSRKVVEVMQSTVDILSQAAYVTTEPGLYNVTFNSFYNYRTSGQDHDANLSTNRLRILVTSNTSKQMTIYNKENLDEILTYNISSSSPVSLENGLFLTNNIKDDMMGTTGLTYILDDVSFAENGGDLWLYYKISNAGFYDLYNRSDNSALFDVVGLALHISGYKESGIMKSNANVVVAQQKPLDTSSRYSSWRGTEREISFSDDSVITIVKIDVSRAVGYQTGSALGTEIGDTVVTFRIYQHHLTTNETELVFEDYVRSGFGVFVGDIDNGSGIGRTEIESNLFEAGLPFYTGVWADDASLRLIDMYNGMPTETSLDFVRYTIGVPESVLLSGEYYTGDSTLVGEGTRTTRLTTGGKVYMLSDKYNVPYSYTGNAVNLRFTLSGTSGGFRYYFGLNTPYVLNLSSNEFELNPRRQRGLILEYVYSTTIDQNTGNPILHDMLRFYYFKYNTIFLGQIIVEEDGELLKYNDGQEHSITIYLDMLNLEEQPQPGFATENYKASVILDKKYVILDGTDLETEERNVIKEVYVPISNNLDKLTNIDYNGYDETEASTRRDLLFMKGVYYMGIEVFDGTEMDILDCIAFEQYDIFG